MQVLTRMMIMMTVWTMALMTAWVTLKMTLRLRISHEHEI